MQMYTGKHPFEGMTPSAVVVDMAAADACPLTFPPDAPPDLTVGRLVRVGALHPGGMVRACRMAC